jgi:hypothetical protein
MQNIRKYSRSKNTNTKHKENMQINCLTGTTEHDRLLGISEVYRFVLWNIVISRRWTIKIEVDNVIKMPIVKLKFKVLL